MMLLAVLHREGKTTHNSQPTSHMSVPSSHVKRYSRNRLCKRQTSRPRLSRGTSVSTDIGMCCAHVLTSANNAQKYHLICKLLLQTSHAKNKHSSLASADES